MGFLDILIGAAILNDLSKKRENKSSDSIFGSSSYNRGYSDGLTMHGTTASSTMNAIADIVRTTTRMVGKVLL